MCKGKYAKSTNYKPLALLLAMALLVGCAVGGTIAWLTDKTGEVKNTFTTSNIDVTLTETKNNFQMIPGWTIDKDPKATVEKNSEDCYLFVKVEKGIGTVKVNDTDKTFDDFLTYEMAEGWNKLTQDKDGEDITDLIYYRVVNKDAAKDQEFYILKDNKVTVKGTVTKEMMDAVTTNNEPTLTFTAYASQLWKTNKPTGEGVTEEQKEAAQFTAAQAWDNCPKT